MRYFLFPALLASVSCLVGPPTQAGVDVDTCLSSIVDVTSPERIESLDRHIVHTMEVTNLSGTPIAALMGEVAYRTEGRTVPWWTENNAWIGIPGGIEPGETRRIEIDNRMLPEWREPLEIDVDILLVFDVNTEIPTNCQ